MRRHKTLLDFSATNKSRELLEEILADGLKENSKTHYLVIFKSIKESGNKYPPERVTLLDWEDNKVKNLVLNKEGRFWIFDVMNKATKILNSDEIKRIEEAEHLFCISEVSSELMIRDKEAFFPWEVGMASIWQSIVLRTPLEGKGFSCICIYKREHLSKVCRELPLGLLCQAHKDMSRILHAKAWSLEKSSG